MNIITNPTSELEKLRIECAMDKTLRAQFIKNPKAVLRKRGVDVPDGLTLKVVEDSMDTMTITLPPFVGPDLSEDNLREAMAGGRCTWCTLCGATTPICAGTLVSLVSLKRTYLCGA
jgi:hypothetical protein